MSIIDRLFERRPATPRIDPAVQHAMRIWSATGVVPVAHMVTDGSEVTEEYELASLRPTVYAHSR